MKPVNQYFPLPIKVFNSVGIQNLFELELKKQFGSESTLEKTLSDSRGRLTSLGFHPAILYNSNLIFTEQLLHTCDLNPAEKFPVKQIYEFEELEDSLKMIAPRIRCESCDHVFQNPTYLGEFNFKKSPNSQNYSLLKPEQLNQLSWGFIGNNNRLISLLLGLELFALPDLEDIELTTNFVDAFMSEKNANRFLNVLSNLDYLKKTNLAERFGKDLKPLTSASDFNTFKLTSKGYKKLQSLEKKANKLTIANQIKFFIYERFEKLTTDALKQGQLLQSEFSKEHLHFKKSIFSDKAEVLHLTPDFVKTTLKQDYIFYWSKRELLDNIKNKPMSWDMLFQFKK